MRRRHSTGTPAGIVAGVTTATIVATTTVALATVTGPFSYYGPVLGISYKNDSFVNYTAQNGPYAGTDVYVTSGGPGYIGQLPRLYKGTALCYQGSDYYYSGPTTYDLYTATHDCGSGTYYGYGVTKAYNGNGYNAYYTYKSPSINR